MTTLYDQYRPSPDGRTPGPLDSCEKAVEEVIRIFGKNISLVGGVATHLGKGVYGVKSPRTVKISGAGDLYGLLFGPMRGAVRLIVYEPHRIEVFGCSGCFRWEVA